MRGPAPFPHPSLNLAQAKVPQVCSPVMCERSANKLRLSDNHKMEENEGIFLRLAPVSGSSLGNYAQQSRLEGPAFTFLCLFFITRWPGRENKGRLIFYNNRSVSRTTRSPFFQIVAWDKTSRRFRIEQKPRRNYFNTLLSAMLLGKLATLWFIWSGWRRVTLPLCCVWCSQASSRDVGLAKLASPSWMFIFSSVYFGMNL